MPSCSSVVVQNLVHLASTLKLPVAYKISELRPHDEGGQAGNGDASPGPAQRSFLVIVHVLGDHAFKKYLQHCSGSDLMLFRGLLLRVRRAAAGFPAYALT